MAQYTRPLMVLALFAVAASVAAPSAARTLIVVPKVALRARAAPKFAAGSPGTLAFAIAAHLAKTKPRRLRPMSEGALPEPYPDGACPSGMANVDDRFCVDRWEATLEEVGGGSSSTPWPATSALDSSKHYRAVSAPGVVPQAYVSGLEADSACHAAGKRLCRGVEWRFACGGSDETVYPYGGAWEEGRCNDRGTPPMLVLYPQTKTTWAFITNTDMNDPRLNQMEGTVAKTGEYSGCANNWGVYDMVGNLHEWIADPHGTFQGGYYLDTRLNGEGCAYRTTAHDFAYHDYSTGFRCCADRLSSRDDEDEDE